MGLIVSICTNLCTVPISQVVYVKGAEVAPIPGPQGPPGTPVSAHHFATFRRRC